MTSPIQRVRVPEESERYSSEADCQSRCDQLNQRLDDGRQAKEADQRANGYLHANAFTSWDHTYFLPVASLTDDYYRPRLVPGNH